MARAWRSGSKYCVEEFGSLSNLQIYKRVAGLRDSCWPTQLFEAVCFHLCRHLATRRVQSHVNLDRSMFVEKDSALKALSELKET